jgi:hypothetical protein
VLNLLGSIESMERSQNMTSAAGLRIALLLVAVVTAGSCASTPTSGTGTPASDADTPTSGTGTSSSTAAVTPSIEASMPEASTVISTDPCALISQDEAATFLGHPITNYTKGTSPIPMPGTHTVSLVTCNFVSAAGGLTVGLARPFSWDVFKSAIPNEFQPLSGLGDAAWQIGPQLAVQKGDAYLAVLVYLNSGADTLDLEKRVAELALTRL